MLRPVRAVAVSLGFLPGLWLSSCAASIPLLGPDSALAAPLVAGLPTPTSSSSDFTIGKRVIEDLDRHLIALYDERANLVNVLLFGEDAPVANWWATLPGVISVKPWIPFPGWVKTSATLALSSGPRQAWFLGLGTDSAGLPGQVVSGRYFFEREVTGGARVALASASFARRNGLSSGKEQQMIGRTVSVSFGESGPWIDLEVVGIFASPEERGGVVRAIDDNDNLPSLLAFLSEAGQMLAPEALPAGEADVLPQLVVPYTLLTASISPGFRSYLITVEHGQLEAVLGQLWTPSGVSLPDQGTDGGRDQPGAGNLDQASSPAEESYNQEGWLAWTRNLDPVAGVVLVLVLVLVLPFVAGYAFWGTLRRLNYRLRQQLGIFESLWDWVPGLIGAVVVAALLVAVRSIFLSPQAYVLPEHSSEFKKVVTQSADALARLLPLSRLFLVTVGLVVLVVAIPAAISYIRYLRSSKEERKRRRVEPSTRPYIIDLPGKFSRWRWIWRRVTFLPLDTAVMLLAAGIGGAALTLSWPVVRGKDPYSTALTHLSPVEQRTITIRPRLLGWSSYISPVRVRITDESVRPISVRDLRLLEEVEGVEAAVAETVVPEAAILAIRDASGHLRPAKGGVTGSEGTSTPDGERAEVEPVKATVIRVTPSWFDSAKSRGAVFEAGAKWLEEDLRKIPALSPGWMYFSTINEWVPVGGTGAALLVRGGSGSRPALELGDQILIRGRLGNGSASLPYSLSTEDKEVISKLPVQPGEHVGWYRIVGVVTPSSYLKLPGMFPAGSQGHERPGVVLLLPLYDWDEVPSVTVIARPGVDLTGLSHYLGRLVDREWGEGRFEVVATVDDLNRRSMPWRALRQRALLLVAFTLALASLATLGVYLLHTSRRLGQIALARALGASRTEIARDIMVELLTIGAAGAAPAAIATWVLAPALFRWVGLNVNEVQLPGLSAILAGVAGTLAAEVMAGIVPAWLAVRSDPRVLLFER
ncbi:MAG TPA: FtsX-like permease family protein [Firmicutes bacterium]|nr:FtsX-like permease family protein [Bacillota bacterium]